MSIGLTASAISSKPPDLCVCQVLAHQSWLQHAIPADISMTTLMNAKTMFKAIEETEPLPGTPGKCVYHPYMVWILAGTAAAGRRRGCRRWKRAWVRQSRMSVEHRVHLKNVVRTWFCVVLCGCVWLSVAVGNCVWHCVTILCAAAGLGYDRDKEDQRAGFTWRGVSDEGAGASQGHQLWLSSSDCGSCVSLRRRACRLSGLLQFSRLFLSRNVESDRLRLADAPSVSAQ